MKILNKVAMARCPLGSYATACMYFKIYSTFHPKHIYIYVYYCTKPKHTHRFTFLLHSHLVRLQAITFSTIEKFSYFSRIFLIEHPNYATVKLDETQISILSPGECSIILQNDAQCFHAELAHGKIKIALDASNMLLEMNVMQCCRHQKISKTNIYFNMEEDNQQCSDFVVESYDGFRNKFTIDGCGREHFQNDIVQSPLEEVCQCYELTDFEMPMERILLISKDMEGNT